MGTPGKPDCPHPAHAGSRVTRAGFYGKPPDRRQRFWCEPRGGGRHRFAPLLPRLGTDEDRCRECEREVAAHEGPQAARLYRYSARDVATALLAVAGGASYREASAQVRVRVGRASKGPHGQMVADWVEAFAPPLWDRFGVDTWPEVIVCDEKRITRRSTSRSGLSSYPTTRKGQKAMKRADSYTLLVATARLGQGWPLVMAHAVPRTAKQRDWEQFYRLLGGRPRAIVADQSPRIFNAAAKVWPLNRTTGEATPQPVLCLYHVKQNFPWPAWFADPKTAEQRKAVAELERAVSVCSDSSKNWLEFIATARRLMPSKALEDFLKYNGRHLKITRQLKAKQPGDPASNSAAENAIRWIFPKVGDRPFTNQQRTNLLLRLMVLEHRGQNDLHEWSHAIRAHAGRNGGRPTGQQRAIADPAGTRSLG